MFQIITPESISMYIQCPFKGYYASIEQPTYLSRASNVIAKVFRKVYFQQMRTSSLVSWKAILRYIEIFSAQEFAGDEDYQKDRRIISRLSVWYHNYYLRYATRVLALVPVSCKMTTHLEFQDTIDIIGLQGRLNLFDIRETGRPSENNPYYISRDWFVAARVWGFYKASGLMPTHYTRFIIKPQTIDSTTMEIEEDQPYLDLFDRTIKHTINGMQQRILYPNIGPQCENCIYKQKCNKEEWNFVESFRRKG